MDTRIPVHNTHTPRLEAAGFTLARGWDEILALDLVTNSTQSHILNFTPNDAAKRFRSAEAAHNWYNEHPRIVYSLASTATSGLIWFGAAPSEYGDYTFAIRMYDQARENGKKKGLAEDFMLAAHCDFRNHMQYDGDIWLETDTNNERAIALYKKVGYKTQRIVNDRLLMTSPTAE